MGWSTYKIREATSKLSYMGRLKFLPQESDARRMHHHIRYQGSRTGWVKRTSAIDINNSGGTRQLATTEREWARTTLAEVAKTRIEECRRKVHRKQNLQL